MVPFHVRRRTGEVQNTDARDDGRTGLSSPIHAVARALCGTPAAGRRLDTAGVPGGRPLDFEAPELKAMVCKRARVGEPARVALAVIREPTRHSQSPPGF